MFDRAAEKGPDDVSERGASCMLPGFDRKKHIAHAVLAVAEVAFFFEDAEKGADRGITWGIGKGGADLGGGGFAAAIDGIHDLAFAAGEIGGGRFHEHEEICCFSSMC